MKKYSMVLSVFLILALSNSYSQNEGVKIGIVGEKFTDFTLKTYQGDQLSTKELRGKNILIISTRGKYNDSYWCGLCFYQYAEFADLELTQKIREKYNMEIMFLLPYNRDTLASWEKNFPGGLAYIENAKNPADPEKLSDGQKEWMNFVRNHYPKTFNFGDKNIPLPLPILVDDKQEVSKGLDLMRTEWGGTKTLQNVPAVYIIDTHGILRFKYISQSTQDRPSAEYILNFIESVQDENQ
ncbi:MAG: redoxin domain-containing protein [Clostridiaceae bacterium]|nr:redoxin domain-containing protein [Clostridiaceae bacterium]